MFHSSSLCFSGSCSVQDRGNKFSVGFKYAQVGQNETWWLDWAKGLFVEFGSQRRQRKPPEGQTVLFDDNRFMVRGSIGQSCTPILQVDFMPGPEFQRDLAISPEGNTISSPSVLLNDLADCSVVTM